MPDPDPVDPNGPQTTGATIPAPSSPEGQADGSPSREGDSTSGGNATTDEAKELRRKVTEQGEALAKYRQMGEIFDRAMGTKAWQAVVDEIQGKPAGDAEWDELDKSVFTEEGAPVGKKWRERLLAEAEARVLRKVQPTLRETKEERARARAAEAENIEGGAEFTQFLEDFEAENPSFRKLKGVDPDAAYRWAASSYSIAEKRNGRTPVGDRAGASLERGGGISAGTVNAASQVKIPRNDPDKWERVMDALGRGLTPVDENGRPYPVPRK